MFVSYLVMICSTWLLQNCNYCDTQLAYQQQKSLAENNEYWKLIGEIASSGILVFDFKKIYYANKRVKQIFSDKDVLNVLEMSNYDQSKQAAKNEEGFYDNLIDFFMCSQEAKQKMRFRNIRIPHKTIESRDDKILEVEAFNTEWFGKRCLILNLIDITHIINFEQIKYENKYKTLYLRSLNHEIRHPITSIQSCYKRIKTTLDEIQTQDSKIVNQVQICNDMLQIIKSESQLLLNKILQIQDIIEIQSQKFQLQVHNFNLTKLVLKCVKLISFQAQRKKVQILVNISSQIPPKIQGDKYRVQRVILILLQNSLANSKQGSINIQAYFYKQKSQQLVNKFIKIKITDSRDYKFESRISANLSAYVKSYEDGQINNAKGFDLDYYIAQQISQQLGERKIKSKQRNQEYNITFQFQVQEIALNNQTLVAPLKMSLLTLDTSSDSTEFLGPCLNIQRLNDYKCKCPQILLVDDSELVRMILYESMKSFYKIDEAQDGYEAVSKVYDQMNSKCCSNFIAIIMDCEMPIMDGQQATQRIRNLGYNGAIIGYTAYANQYDIQKCLQVGMDHVLFKPSSNKKIMATIRKYFKLNNKQESGELLSNIDQ